MSICLFVAACSGSPMLGERERDREAVQWELGDSTTPPSYNNGGPQQQNNSMDSGGGGDGGGGGRIPCGYHMAYGSSIDDGIVGPHTTTNSHYGQAASGSGSGGGGIGGPGKEVRYAPLPTTAAGSPTHSNPISQAPLQRAHSR